jgi:hypothetical protein
VSESHALLTRGVSLSIDRSSSLANSTTLAACNYIVHTRLMVTSSGYLHRWNAAFSIVPFCCSWWFSARCRLIQECWDPTPSVRPTFAEIIVRLNKIHASCAKQGRWRDTFKLPWYISGWSYHMSSISCQSPQSNSSLKCYPFPAIASPFWCAFQNMNVAHCYAIKICLVGIVGLNHTPRFIWHRKQTGER